MNGPDTGAQERIRDLYAVATEIQNNVQEAVYTEPASQPAGKPAPVSPIDDDSPDIPTGISPGQPIGRPPPSRKPKVSVAGWVWIILVSALIIVGLYRAAENDLLGDSGHTKPDIPQTAIASNADPGPDVAVVNSNPERAGPHFSVVYPQGSYTLESCHTQLVYSVINSPGGSSLSLSFDELKRLVRNAKSKLHLAGIDGAYTLLEKNSLLILKHVSTCTEPVRIVGVGISFGETDNGLFNVAMVVEGSPAALAGMKTGDRIAEIDGISSTDLTLTDAVSSLRGTQGTAVKIAVLRGMDQQLVEMSLVRARIDTEQTNTTSGWLAVHRDQSGRFNVGRNFENTWNRFSVGTPVAGEWPLGTQKLVISAERPKISRDISGRAVLYSFTFG